ncbi:MAG: cobalamin biosynthesis protein CobQ [Shimia sp.]
MNTPAHLIVGAAAFGRPEANRVTLAALAGGFAPDASLYLMAIGARVLGWSWEVIFRDLYFSDAWQQVFAVDNSFILWGLGLGLALWLRSAWAVAFTGAALLHLAFDFPLHAEDARMHFWPLTEWKFISPYSYWDGNAGARFIEWGEAALVAALTAFLVIRFKTWCWRVTFLAIGGLQVLPFVMWRLFF